MQKKLIIHYACTSLEAGPKNHITAISVYDLESMEEHSFSLYEEKQVSGKEPIDVLEESMLQKFFDFTASYFEPLWIHWHMSEHNYGFEVLRERYMLLSGQEAPQFGDTIDLADMFYVSYKEQCGIYPKLLPIIRANKLPTLHILSGAEEAKAFVKGNYKKIQRSSLNKVLVMSNLYHRLESRSFITPCQMRNNHLMIIGLSIVGLALWMIFGK